MPAPAERTNFRNNRTHFGANVLNVAAGARFPTVAPAAVGGHTHC